MNLISLRIDSEARFLEIILSVLKISTKFKYILIIGIFSMDSLASYSLII